MTEPLPNWRSIWDRAPCRAVSLAFEGSWLLMECTLGAASDGANTCAPFGTQLVHLRDYSVDEGPSRSQRVNSSARDARAAAMSGAPSRSESLRPPSVPDRRPPERSVTVPRAAS